MTTINNQMTTISPPETAIARFLRWTRPFERLMTAIFILAPDTKKRVWHSCYGRVNGGLNNAAPPRLFINYGYAHLDPAEPAIDLEEEDEANRHSIQLYHRVAGAIDLSGKDVLEVGCGRGGGGSFVMRYLRPRSATGVDFSEEAVDFCKTHHQTEGLSFARGDAEDLPFPRDSFDVVLNVESSHCYPSMDRFLGEVARVLRPGGHLLFADLHGSKQRVQLRAQVRRAGMTIIEEETIADNVIQAMNLEHDRNIAMVRNHWSGFMRVLFEHFWGVKGSRPYDALSDGRLTYVRLVARKGAVEVPVGAG